MLARRSAADEEEAMGVGPTMRWAGLAAVTVTLLLAGCGDGPGDEPASPSVEARSTTTAPAYDAASVLDDHGLALPADATQSGLDVLPDQEDQGMRDVYRVTFTAPADAVEQMCLDAGIGPPFPASYLSSADRALYQVDEDPEGAWTCEASRPDDLRQQLRVLYWGDPASVIVVLYTMVGH